MKYKVLGEVEIFGEVLAVNSEVEIDAETAAPFVADGKLAFVEVKEETPNTSVASASEAISDISNENTVSTPAQPEHKKEEWVGNHTIQKPGDK